MKNLLYHIRLIQVYVAALFLAAMAEQFPEQGIFIRSLGYCFVGFILYTVSQLGEEK